MRPTIAILGAGSLGEIFAKGLLRAGWEPTELVLAARRAERAVEAEKATGVTTLLDASEAAAGREVVILAVKPKDAVGLLHTLQGTIQAGQVVVSVMAGVPLAVFERELPGIAVIRAMPNTPAAVDEGMTAFCGGTFADDPALAVAETVLGAVGETIHLSEDLLDAVTAVSGTGPAYIFLLAEAMTDAAIREGLPRDAAVKLVDQTLRGSGKLVAESHLPPVELRAQVTSPGGTTAAAVHVLEEGGFRALMEDAVRAAAARSREMGARAAADEE